MVCIYTSRGGSIPLLYLYAVYRAAKRPGTVSARLELAWVRGRRLEWVQEQEAEPVLI